MATKSAPPTIERLKEALQYDPETGAFTWRIDRHSMKVKGKPAGSYDTAGYLGICLDYRRHLAHRLAWLYVYGEWPDREVDHINCDRKDNRICNLRLATTNQNRWNSKVQKNSRTGVKGVRWSPRGKNWRATIRVNCKRIHLGCFPTVEEASEAYRAASAKYHGEFGRSN